MQRLITLMLVLNININFSQEIVPDNYTFENGVINNRTYTCNKFDWKISFPEGTTVTTLNRVDELNSKGYEAVKKETPSGIQIQKSQSHLIGFSFSKYNYLLASFESLKGTKQMTFEEHQKFISKLLEDTYSKMEPLKMTQSVSYEKLGVYNFYIIKGEVFDKRNDKLLLTQLLYNAFIDDNLFSVSINYTDENYGQILINNFKESLSKKK